MSKGFIIIIFKSMHISQLKKIPQENTQIFLSICLKAATFFSQWKLWNTAWFYFLPLHVWTCWYFVWEIWKTLNIFTGMISVFCYVQKYVTFSMNMWLLMQSICEWCPYSGHIFMVVSRQKSVITSWLVFSLSHSMMLLLENFNYIHT